VCEELFCSLIGVARIYVFGRFGVINMLEIGNSKADIAKYVERLMNSLPENPTQAQVIIRLQSIRMLLVNSNSPIFHQMVPLN